MKTKLLSLLLLTVISITSAQIPNTGLLKEYLFTLTNGTSLLNSHTPGTYDLTIMGGAPALNTDALGQNNSAMYLNGGDILNAGQHSTTTGNISVSFWIKTTDMSTSIKYVLRQYAYRPGSSVSWAGYRCSLNDGKLNFEGTFRLATANYTSPANLVSPVIADGNWHHIVVTGERADPNAFQSQYSYKMFVDGAESTTGTTGIIGGGASMTAYIFEGNPNLSIGSVQYQGGIDNIRVYTRVLTPSEVSNLYQEMCTSNACCLIAPNNNVFQIDNNSTSSLSLNINSSDTFDVAYHEVGQSFSSAIFVNNVVSATTLNNLSPGKEYDVYIRKHCASGTVSNWSAANRYKTNGIIYVDTNNAGNTNNDGSSWATAFGGLQPALANATDGDEIWMTGGTYVPHSNDRAIYYEVTVPNLKIYGGFAGTETNLNERAANTNANQTILSGDLRRNDSNINTYVSNYYNTTRINDNSYHVIYILGNGNNLLLDRLTISGAHNSLTSGEGGGAILKHKSVPKLTLKNCKIQDNVSRNANAGLLAEFELNNLGGTRGELIIEGCYFVRNMSRWATGVYSFAGANTNVDIKVVNSVFYKNIAADLDPSTVKGLSGSASWFRVVGDNSNVDLQLINNVYAYNEDSGTHQSLGNSSLATVAISKNNGTNRVMNATVANSIFWANKANSGVATRSITDLYLSPIDQLNVYNSIDEQDFNDSSITSKTNTSSANPMFSNPTGGGFTLQSGSPAIDTGDNSKLPTGLTTDIIYRQRIFNNTVDMGVFEYGAPSTLSINNYNRKLTGVILYPNPAKNILNIKLDEVNELIERVEVYSIHGQKILTTKNSSIDISNLSHGMYLLKVFSTNEKVGVKRFIKEK